MTQNMLQRHFVVLKSLKIRTFANIYLLFSKEKHTFAINQRPMKKTILSILLLSLGTFGTQAMAAEATPSWLEALEVSQQNEVRISVSGNNVRVQNAQGATLEIYNITGVKVADFKIDSPDKTINTGLTRGCYIVKVGKVARKISIL